MVTAEADVSFRQLDSRRHAPFGAKLRHASHRPIIILFYASLSVVRSDLRKRRHFPRRLTSVRAGEPEGSAPLYMSDRR